MRVPAIAILNVYVHESSQDDHRYMVLSGIAVDAFDLDEVEVALRAVQDRHRTLGTMKWGKVSKAACVSRLLRCLFHSTRAGSSPLPQPDHGHGPVGQLKV
jgi:hypothetical protein